MGNKNKPDPADPKRPLSADALQAQTKNFIDALNHETPLACVLVATSFIEQCLSTLLHAFMIKSDTADGMFDYKKGTLRDMRSRANMGYCLGLLSAGLYGDLITIGEIRNRFAHAHFEIDFDDPKVRELCDDLVFDTPGTFVSNTEGRTAEHVLADIGETPQVRFIFASFTVALSILKTCRETIRRTTPTDTWTITGKHS